MPKRRREEAAEAPAEAAEQPGAGASPARRSPRAHKVAETKERKTKQATSGASAPDPSPEAETSPKAAKGKKAASKKAAAAPAAVPAAAETVAPAAAPTSAPVAGPDAPKGTTGAKAQSAGAKSVERTETPRPERASDGLVAIHWNVAGLNGLLQNPHRKELLVRLAAEEAPDVLALSEHKISEEKQAAAEAGLLDALPGYSAHWAVCTVKKGYSGVVLLVRNGLNARNVEIDAICKLNEGRTICVELDDIFLVATYVPNSGQDLKRLDFRTSTWDPELRGYVHNKQATKPVVIIGDLNVAHLDADIWNVTAKHIPKSAGLTPQERNSFGKLLEEVELVDAFRTLFPDATGCFSYWSTRSGNHLLNRGLRLDYALLSRSLTAGGAGPMLLHDCQMLHKFAPNGDHAPTALALRRR